MLVYPRRVTLPRRCAHKKVRKWWFGTWILFFHSVGNNHPNWLIFFRGIETTNQNMWYFQGICPIDIDHVKTTRFLLAQPFFSRCQVMRTKWCRCPWQAGLWGGGRKNPWKTPWIPWENTDKTHELPSGYVKHSYWKWPIEIVDFPINSMVIFHSYVWHNQRVWRFTHQTGQIFHHHRTRKNVSALEPRSKIGIKIGNLGRTEILVLWFV